MAKQFIGGKYISVTPDLGKEYPTSVLQLEKRYATRTLKLEEITTSMIAHTKSRGIMLFGVVFENGITLFTTGTDAESVKKRFNSQGKVQKVIRIRED